MSVVIFASGESEFVPLPGVYAVATQLRQEGIPALVVRHLFRMSDDDAWACCRHLAEGEPAAVVLHINLPLTLSSYEVDVGMLPAILKRVELVKIAFAGRARLIGTGGLFQFGAEHATPVASLLDARVDAPYGFADAVRRAHGFAEEPSAPVLSRKALDLWPAELAGGTSSIMLQPEPCLGLCGMCPNIRNCNWDRIPTWERATEDLKTAFTAELRRTVLDYGVRHLSLVDFQTDASLAKAKWLRKTLAEVGPVRFAANLVLDNLVRNPEVLEELLAAGLVACNLQIGSLRADARRAQGFVREDGRLLLLRLRELAGPQLWVHGHLAIGMPGDTAAGAAHDVAWLTGDEGRRVLDTLSYVPQAVLPGSQLAIAGGYQFHHDTASPWSVPTWQGPHMAYAEADRLASEVMAGYYGDNKLRQVWRGANELLGVVNLGLDVDTAARLHRSAWTMPLAAQEEWLQRLQNLETLAIRRYASAVRLGAYG